MKGKLMKLTKQMMMPATALGVLALAAAPAFGQPYNVSIDENGNGFLSGSVLPHAIGVEPISGISTLYYISPVPVQPGDVALFETAASGVPSDLLRFGGPNNTYVYFFSDMEATDKAPFDLADVPQLPPPLTNAPIVQLVESGLEGANGANYTPTAVQPGSYPGVVINYQIISDVPEPNGLALASLGGGLLLLFRRRLYSRAG
jgi:hypothetical protein